MNAVCPFIDRGDTGVAPGLGNVILIKIAIATQHLNPEIGGPDPSLRRKHLAHRRQEIGKRQLVRILEYDKGQMAHCPRPDSKSALFIKHLANISVV